MTGVSRDYSARIFDSSILVIIAIFSFFLSLKAGERGFFAFDQSIVFDGSYRILSGQVPYKDFIMPIGPMVFWLQAIFFKAFGINYFSYLVCAAFINVIAVMCSIVIIRLFFPRNKFFSYIAGLLTAIWFYPPFGTPWTEQTAFFFSFLALTLILCARYYIKSRRVINGLLLLSGCFALLSFLSKQNAGLYILPLYFLLLVVAYEPESKAVLNNCAMFLAGFIAAGLLFLLWLWVKSDLKIFLQHFFQIPSLLGVCRLLEERGDLFIIFFGGSCHYSRLHWLPLGIRLIFFCAFLISVFVFAFYIYNYRKAKDSWQREFLASIFCIYVIFFQYLFIHTTMNQAENGIPFIGIIFSIGLGLLLRLYNNLGLDRIKLISAAGSVLLIFYLSTLGIKVSLTRKVQEFRKAEFPKYLTVDRLKALRWGQPSIVGGSDVKEEDIVRVIGYLKAKNKNFFIFPNFTFLYALLDVPSPQPILWFHKGLTYHVLYDPGLDKWIVDDLIKNKVEIVIIEEKPSSYSTLNDFLQLESYLRNNFSKVQRFGIFNVYEKVKLSYGIGKS